MAGIDNIGIKLINVLTEYCSHKIQVVLWNWTELKMAANCNHDDYYILFQPFKIL